MSTRRDFLKLSLGAAAAALPGLHASGALAAPTPRVLRIGNQKGALSLLKGRGSLEKRLAPLGVNVTWTEFNAGPVQLEALNVGSIDFGDVGDAPPIFAQAAGAPLAYVAATLPRPRSEAVIVPGNSPLREVADLNGKRVAFNRASNVHFFLVQLLRKHGLDYGDIRPVFLSPPDARAAFENGSIDAWVIWDPFYAAAQATLGARLLADATSVDGNRGFYFSSQNFARQNPDVIRIVVDEISKTDEWGKTHRTEYSAELAKLWGLPAPIVQQAIDRTEFGTVTITKPILGEQQVIADTFHELGLVPKRVDVLQAAAPGLV
ncbi:sulfonate ABC transporter substrate-binding protein [Burkholderia sp. Ax-1719]|uniref:sulfonate ABC transporter substrate-binding protein n=1 Tax=Burkholderia sp. Ax-1719 TaxID=2608334 RepID=UPI0014216BBD|nr:sulfonate ABC transporter substrate-binding protein [Burkholderia sp. Ax-1719]NIE66439.1 sulfonate ABC transporter substrate-binding protein [Burkholderia sp. Ax-1719]